MLLLPDSVMLLGLDRASASEVSLEARLVLREYLTQETSPVLEPERSGLFSK